MNTSLRFWTLLAVAIAFTAGPSKRAAAQCAVCPTTPVVAYQPVAAPVVTPVDPGLIGGWYPGKLLDRLFANRIASAATLPAATTAYRPIATAVPTTSYRPLSSLHTTSYAPVSVYRPVMAAPAIATTAYSPVVTSSAVCCDPCSTASVVNYATPASACCGTTVGGTAVGGTSYGGMATEQPALGAEVPLPGSVRYPPSPPQNNSPGAAGEDTVLDGNNGEANGSQPSQQNETAPSGASFEPPPLYVPGLPETAEETQDHVARAFRTDAVPAVYTTPVRPQLVRERGTQRSGTGTKALPSRAERDAGWSAVSD